MPDDVKLFAKRLLIGVAGLSFRLPSARARMAFVNLVAPRLQDDRVLPNTLTPRRLRHGRYRALCNPHTYSHQPCYWFGLLFDCELENYMVANVGVGDTVIDVGMNVGQVSALAASLVGEAGRVIAFEPNKLLAETVTAHLRKEGVRNVHVFDCALGAVPAKLSLKFDPSHLGGATLRQDAAALQSTDCNVAVADDLLRGETMPGRVFLKMDVEGFEVEALSGMRTVLERIDHAVIEVTPEWLKPAGIENLFSLLEDAGMRAERLSPLGLPSGPLKPSQVTRQENVLFRRPT